MSVRYAIGLPNVGEFGHPDVLVELAVSAERAGWDGVYLWDHLLYHDQTWAVANPAVTAGAIAAATSRARLILMHVLPRRRVQVAAREALTIDALSQGRLTFAAAIGGSDAEYESFGESPDLRGRGAALDRALDDLVALWSGEPVVVAGASVPVQMRPISSQQPRIPIWCGGRWPNQPPLRRAARFDGVMPTFADQRTRAVPPAELASAVSYVAGVRDPSLGPFDVALEGASEPGQLDATPYAEVGLTWWIEAVGWWRGGLPAARTRISAGP